MRPVSIDQRTGYDRMVPIVKQSGSELSNCFGRFPPRGAGRFGEGREGVVLLRSVTCRVSTANSTLMVGGV